MIAHKEILGKTGKTEHDMNTLGMRKTSMMTEKAYIDQNAQETDDIRRNVRSKTSIHKGKTDEVDPDDSTQRPQRNERIFRMRKKGTTAYKAVTTKTGKKIKNCCNEDEIELLEVKTYEDDRTEKFS